MRALVFGSTGQVARELALTCPAGCEAIFLDRASADLSQPEQCRATIADGDWDVVINAAAYTAVDRAEEEEELACLINGAAPAAMAQAAAAKDIPFLHISTDYVFDGSGSTPWSVDAQTNPQGAYGRSKLIGEESVVQVGGAYAIVRTSWVFSAYGTNFVKTMLRLAKDHERLTIVADQIGGPTAARDIARALWHMAAAFTNGHGRSGLYHLSGGPDVSWADFAREIFAQADIRIDVQDIPSSAYPTPATRPLNSRLDNGALQASFALERPDWRVSLKDILQSIKGD